MTRSSGAIPRREVITTNASDGSFVARGSPTAVPTHKCVRASGGSPCPQAPLSGAVGEAHAHKNRQHSSGLPQTIMGVRGHSHPGEWRLHPEVVQAIWQQYGRAEVDLFASRDSTHCLLWFSLEETMSPLGQDALAHEWPQQLLYAFPPLPLI